MVKVPFYFYGRYSFRVLIVIDMQLQELTNHFPMVGIEFFLCLGALVH